jgi:hypothetical protein
VEQAPPEESEETRAARLARSRGSRRRWYIIGAVIGVACVGVLVGIAAFWQTDDSPADAQSAAPIADTTPETKATTTTHKPTTTTTTIPPVKQPKDVKMPALNGNTLRRGQSSELIKAYEQRMKDLRLDPGEVDGTFDQNTWYAVSTVQKYFGHDRTGVIDEAVRLRLSHWEWAPAKPDTVEWRVEIDLDKQVLTVYKGWQPILVTTTSTGSGEYFCGGRDGCQYAITPAGEYKFYYLHKGWQDGKLGRMWNPFYFNGGIAVHGLASVPNTPASHGCARIPMDIATYFPALVAKDVSVFVVGTPKQAGDRYVGKVRNPTPASTTPPATVAPLTTPPTSPPTTKKPTPTTHAPTTTVAKP